MPKRYRSNYSLWPEQARPRRALPMVLAAGGFAIGIVFAVTAHNLVTDFFRPGSVQETVRDAANTHAPVYATAPITPPAADVAEAAADRPRGRLNIAKVTLPSIGTRPASVVATDGRGGTGDGQSAPLSSEPLAVAPSAVLAAIPSIIEEAKPAAEPKTAEEGAPKAKRERRSKTYASTRKERPARSYASHRSRPRYYAGGGTPSFGYRSFGYRPSAGGSGYSQIFARQQY